MAVAPDSNTQPGTRGHPEHDAWLLALGKATYAALLVSGIAFDLLRVLGDVAESDMYDDPLGRLESKLRGMMKRRPDIHELAEFVEQLAAARDSRNDLLHAHPVHSGLHRRRAKDPSFVRNFYDIASLDAVREEMEALSLRGVEILYRDEGAEVRRWYAEAK